MVVEFGVVGFDAVEEEVAGFFEKGVDAEVEGVEVWCQGGERCGVRGEGEGG